MINKLAIVGVGLIGGSLARALKRAGAVREVLGYGRSLENLQRAVALQAIDYAEPSLARVAQQADMIVLAVPVGSMAEILVGLAPYLSERTVLTDAGSVKGSVVAAARAALGRHFPRFVPGHPIAGTEKSGVEAALPDLFEGRRVVLTPLPETERAALEQVQAMWRAAGAQVSLMPVERHDQALAATSHLPPVLAYALVDLLARMDGDRTLFDFAAGGFQDFTRIASSDPVMWRDICLANRQALGPVLRRYRDELDAVLAAIEQGDGVRLLETFGRAKRVRDELNKKL